MKYVNCYLSDPTVKIKKSDLEILFNIRSIVEKLCNCNYWIWLTDKEKIKQISENGEEVDRVELIYYWLDENNALSSNCMEEISLLSGMVSHLTILLRADKGISTEEYRHLYQQIQANCKELENVSILGYTKIDDIVFYLFMDALIACDFPLSSDFEQDFENRRINVGEYALFSNGENDLLLPENIALFRNNSLWECIRYDLDLLYGEFGGRDYVYTLRAPNYPFFDNSLFNNLKEDMIILLEAFISFFYLLRARLLNKAEGNINDIIFRFLSGDLNVIFEEGFGDCYEKTNLVNNSKRVIDSYIPIKILELIKAEQANSVIRSIEEEYIKEFAPKYLEIVKSSKCRVEYIYFLYFNSFMFMDYKPEDKEKNMDWLIANIDLIDDLVVKAKIRLYYARLYEKRILCLHDEIDRIHGEIHNDPSKLQPERTEQNEHLFIELDRLYEQEKELDELNQDNLPKACSYLEAALSSREIYDGDFLNTEGVEIIDLLLKCYDKMAEIRPEVNDSNIDETLSIAHKTEELLIKKRKGTPYIVYDNYLSDCYSELGWLYDFKGDVELAILNYRKAISARKKDKRYNYFLGHSYDALSDIYTRIEKTDEAKECYRKRNYFYKLGIQEEEQEELQMQIDEKPVKQWDATYVFVYMHYGKVSRDMKVYDLAIKYYNMALKHCKGVSFLDKKLLCSRYIEELEKIIKEESEK